MYASVGTLLSFALCIALNPVSIVAAILLLTSNQGSPKGFAYLAGWLVGLITLTFVALLIVITWDFSRGSVNAEFTAWVILSAGIVLLFMAYNQWRQRPPPGAEIMPIEWLRALPRTTSFMALSAGLFFSLFSVKNLLLTAAAAVMIGEARLTLDKSIVTVVIFIAVATLGIAAPIFVSMTHSDWGRALLTDWEYKLSNHNVAVTCIVLVIIAVQLVGVGLGGLLGG